MNRVLYCSRYISALLIAWIYAKTCNFFLSRLMLHLGNHDNTSIFEIPKWLKETTYFSPAIDFKVIIFIWQTLCVFNFSYCIDRSLLNANKMQVMNDESSARSQSQSFFFMCYVDQTNKWMLKAKHKKKKNGRTLIRERFNDIDYICRYI